MGTHIYINLDQDHEAPIEGRTLAQMLTPLGWPEGAVCATQEKDGEILYWNCTLDTAKAARIMDQTGTGLMPLIGFKYQVHAAYSDDDHPTRAKDWMTAVVTESDLH